MLVNAARPAQNLLLFPVFLFLTGRSFCAEIPLLSCQRRPQQILNRRRHAP